LDRDWPMEGVLEPSMVWVGHIEGRVPGLDMQPELLAKRTNMHPNPHPARVTRQCFLFMSLFPSFGRPCTKLLIAIAHCFNRCDRYSFHLGCSAEIDLHMKKIGEGPEMGELLQTDARRKREARALEIPQATRGNPRPKHRSLARVDRQKGSPIQ
jgi:hypothetical protein